ncbi:hypothetical protein B5G20_07390 [Collinsella sp. An7]|nr:hypothetical protein B5G20_07390 [Collinsella sp. An7]
MILMSDEKMTTPERPPEKEEAAPAPASALGTATTSNDVTNDITMPHGDTQLITEANIDEIPAQEGVAAPDGGAGDQVPVAPPRVVSVDRDRHAMMFARSLPELRRAVASHIATVVARPGVRVFDELIGAEPGEFGGPDGVASPADLTNSLALVASAFTSELERWTEICNDRRLVSVGSNAERSRRRWKYDYTGPNGIEGAIMLLGWHANPENGKLVMVAAPTQGSDEISEDAAAQGYLWHFDPETHRWEMAEHADGPNVIGYIRRAFDELCFGKGDRQFKEFRAYVRNHVEVVNIEAMIKAGEVDPYLSITNEGAKIWHRRTFGLFDPTGDVRELAYKKTAFGVHMEDDGTGHAVVVDEPEWDFPDSEGNMQHIRASELFANMFEERDREDGVAMVWQVLEQFVNRSFTDRTSPYLFGPAGAGKSFIVRTCQSLCGGDFAELSLGDFGNDKAVATIPGKAAVIGEDNAPDEKIKGTGTRRFKNAVDQGTVSVDPLYETRKKFVTHASFIQAGNQRPRTDDRSGAVASRLVICPFTKSFYQDKTHNEHVTGELPDDPEWKRWATQQSAIRCNGLFGHYDIEGNRVLKQAHDEFVDANDYVRLFMRQFAAELDEADVDCVPMPALHEAFKDYFREKISQRGASASFDGEFKLSLVQIADELGWEAELDEHGQWKTSTLRRGFFEPERLHGVLARYTTTRGHDRDGQVIYSNQRLMRWVNGQELAGDALNGSKGLLRRSVRGVLYRRSALERYEEDGVTPAQAHLAARAEEHARHWADAADSGKEAYGNFVHSLVFCGTGSYGPDFGDFGSFGANGDGEARATYGEALSETGLPYPVPTYGEWVLQGCPTGVVPEGAFSYGHLKELGALVGRTRSRFIVRDDRVLFGVYLPDDDPDGLDDPDDDPTPGPGAAPTSSDAPEGVKTPDETAAQGTCGASAPADGAHEAPAPSDRAPAANGPSAPAEAPVSAAPATVEGGDAAEEAPGAPDPGYEAFVRHAEGAVEHSGGYVVLDGGPEGTTVCREVIDEDEWAAYGGPTSLRGTVVIDGERLPLIE